MKLPTHCTDIKNANLEDGEVAGRSRDNGNAGIMILERTIARTTTLIS
jgi:hypothetical protein